MSRSRSGDFRERVTEQSQAGFYFGGEGVDSVLHIDRELLTVSSGSGGSGQGEGLWTYCVVAHGL